MTRATSHGVALAGARVLITGGAGVVGSTLADTLAAHEPAEIVILDNFTRGRKEHLESCRERTAMNIVEGDIRDRALVDEVTEGIDVVYHQAAIRLPHCAQDPRLAMEVMVNGTFNVVEAAHRAGVKKVVAASSASVYGLAAHFPTVETDHPYGNRTLYGAAKLFNEGLLRSFHEDRGLNYVALRYFNVYGPRMDVHSAHVEVFVHWMERIAQGRAPVIHGDGTDTADFVYVDDIARANVLAATSDVTDAVFNIGSGQETPLEQLARMLIVAMGADLSPERAPDKGSRTIARRVADISAANDALGWQPEVDLRTGLDRLVTWWRANRPHTDG